MFCVQICIIFNEVKAGALCAIPILLTAWKTRNKIQNAPDWQEVQTLDELGVEKKEGLLHFPLEWSWLLRDFCSQKDAVGFVVPQKSNLIPYCSPYSLMMCLIQQVLLCADDIETIIEQK